MAHGARLKGEGARVKGQGGCGRKDKAPIAPLFTENSPH
jgi:hypothetical protein